MRVEFILPDEDLEIIKDNIDFFKQTFLRFDIISDQFMIDDDPTVEYIGNAHEFTFKEATFEIDSLNNLWAMAKLVQNFKIEGLFKI